MIEKNLIQKINDHLQDQLSKDIFANCLLFGITQDESYLKGVIRGSKPYQLFLNMLKNDPEEKLVYGAGGFGKSFIRCFADEIIFRGGLDIAHFGHTFEGVTIYNAERYLSKYSGERIYTCVFRKDDEIAAYLMQKGVPAEKIVPVTKIWGERVNDLQYFDLPELTPCADEVLVDGGAFRGETSEAFIKWTSGDFKKIYTYEPDPVNCGPLKQRMNTIAPGKYQLIEKGLWDKETELHFNMTNGTDGSICEDGEAIVPVTSVDTTVSEPVTFIKFDIEGAELRALEGARRQITENKPRLAICVYHKPEDIYEIPRLILEMNPEYRFYLRHYSTFMWETVLYAI